MAIVLCGDSAQHVLKSLSDDELEKVMPIDAGDVFFETPAWKAARDLSYSVWGEPGLVADVLVTKYKNRRCSQSLKCRTWTSSIPKQSLAQLPDGRVVSTPWFDLLMDASSLSMTTISRRIMEMTSVYRLDANSVDGFIESSPLITRDSLEAYFDEAKGSMGITKIRSALSWSPPLARSPREIDATLPLTMPHRLDGCGLPTPKLNREVSLGLRAKRMMSQDVCFVDLLWEPVGENGRRAGVEYLGRYRHQNIGTELVRVNALELEGVSLHLLANEQLSDARQLLMTAQRIARDIDFTPFGNRWPSIDRFQRLINSILGGA